MAPGVLASSLDVGDLATGGAMSGLWNAENVASLVPLEVLLQVQLEVAGGVGSARHSGERGLTARRAELL